MILAIVLGVLIVLMLVGLWLAIEMRRQRKKAAKKRRRQVRRSIDSIATATVQEMIREANRSRKP